VRAVDGELTDAKEILRRAEAAAKKVRFASYTADYKGTGWIAEFVPHVTGEAIVGPDGEHDVPRFFCKVALKKNDSEEVLNYTAGCNGDEYFLLDPKTKKAHHDIDPVVLGSESRNLQRVVLREFAEKEPFKDALEATDVQLSGTRTVDGELCYEVQINTPDERQRAIVWSISTTDFLPRNVKRIYKGREEGTPDGTTELTISRLVAKPNWEKNKFEMVVPAGYTATDEFPE
jgi:hypothetical protein